MARSSKLASAVSVAAYGLTKRVALKFLTGADVEALYKKPGLLWQNEDHRRQIRPVAVEVASTTSWRS